MNTLRPNFYDASFTPTDRLRTLVICWQSPATGCCVKGRSLELDQLLVRYGKGAMYRCQLKFWHLIVLAEVVGFELTVPFGTTVFKTAALNHSATLPYFFTNMYNYKYFYVQRTYPI